MATQDVRAEWKKIQEKERSSARARTSAPAARAGSRARSFNSFVDAMERGEATPTLLAVNPDLVRKGKSP